MVWLVGVWKNMRGCFKKNKTLWLVYCWGFEPVIAGIASKYEDNSEITQEQEMKEIFWFRHQPKLGSSLKDPRKQWKEKKNKPYNNQNALHLDRSINPQAGGWSTASLASARKQQQETIQQPAASKNVRRETGNERDYGWNLMRVP